MKSLRWDEIWTEEEFFALGEKCALLMSVCFPGVDPWEVDGLTCDDCEDLRWALCEGKGLQGHEIIRCMAESVLMDEGIMMIIGPRRPGTSRLTSSQRRKRLRRKRG